jgi:uncharacterized protein YndB with AHSA1/START domain
VTPRRAVPTDHEPVPLHADDAAFIRAPEAMIYRRLTHVAAWPTWWSGCTVEALAATSSGGERWAVSLRGGRAHRLRLAVRPHSWRHDLGLVLALDGDLVGRGEFWLEPTHGGTVVHQLLVATTPLARPLRVLERYRQAARRGVWGLKDVLQLEARSSVGLRP